MGRKCNRYAVHVQGLNVKYNKSNEAVICKYCAAEKTDQWAVENTRMPKTKKMIKNHMKRCHAFAKHCVNTGMDWDFSDTESSIGSRNIMTMEEARPLDVHEQAAFEMATTTMATTPTPQPPMSNKRKATFDAHAEQRSLREMEVDRLEFERMRFNQTMEEFVKEREAREKEREEEMNLVREDRQVLHQRLTRVEETLQAILEGMGNSAEQAEKKQDE